jgi:uncharacterized protein (TIGR02147 family)
MLLKKAVGLYLRYIIVKEICSISTFPLIHAMKSIFEYIDYRKFLRDFYAESKSTTGYFSYRYFARKARIHAPIFLKLVIDGKRNLSRSTIDKFIAGLGLKEKAASYFRALVLFNQATSSLEKQEYYRALRVLHKMVPQHVIEDERFEYFDKWYYSVLREGLCHKDFKEDWERIALCVRPNITPSEARDAVEWLLNHKFLKKTKQGTYEQINRAITTRSEVYSFVARNFHRKMIQLAEQSLDSYPVSKRYATGITFGVDAQTYGMLVAEIEAFRDRVVQFVNSIPKTNQVYQINIQFFPVMFEEEDA